MDYLGSKINTDPWISWTPTLVGITLNNGTLSCAYKQVGKTVFYRFQMTAGSSTTIAASAATFTLPLTAVSAMLAHSPIGQLIFYDSSVPLHFKGAIELESSTVAGLYIGYANGTFDYVGIIQSGVPVTIATGDIISGYGQYETN